LTGSITNIACDVYTYTHTANSLANSHPAYMVTRACKHM